MNKKLLERIQTIFLASIADKPTWGKNEIRLLYLESVTKALVELTDEQQKEIDIMTGMQ